MLGSVKPDLGILPDVNLPSRIEAVPYQSRAVHEPLQ